MKVRDYIKSDKLVKPEISVAQITELIFKGFNEHRKFISGTFVVVLLLCSSMCLFRNTQKADIDDISKVNFTEKVMALSSSQRSVITVPKGIVKANPFVPYRDINDTGVVNDVPAYNIVEPPEVINENSDAARVMDTIVSGILYDKFSPSAIINIEGNDYLVKKGDVVNNYKVINITQDSVTVQLGKNAYKAGIGEILTEGVVNHNDVANLKNKFGGVK